MSISIVEDYADYTPPAWVRPTVERLLASLSTAHLNGLSAIVLSDGATATERKVRVARRNRHGIFIGRYHHAWKQDSAWIEIVVDRTIDRVPRRYHGVQFIRDFVIGEVLFHEVGHHLHFAIGSAERGGEESAEDWAMRLAVVHFGKRYGHLRPILPMIRWIAGVMARRERYELSRSRQRRQRQTRR
jgi:hypothetical protein